MRIVYTEVVSETAFDEDIRQISKSEKRPKREFFMEQSKDVLRPDSLETCLGAVPVYVFALYSFELMVRLIAIRNKLPDFLNDFQRLGPSHMTIPTDHVGSHKNAIIL